MPAPILVKPVPLTTPSKLRLPAPPMFGAGGTEMPAEVEAAEALLLTSELLPPDSS